MSSSSTLHDYVVVGAGVAGSVIAARLSEHQGGVLLLEAGGSTPPLESAIPPVWPSLAATEWSWGDSTPTRSASDRATAIPRGRGVGGSSAINGMVFVRGHRDGYAAWESAGAKGWGFDDLLPYFMRSETAVGRDPEVRGVAGPLVVAPADPLNEVHAACLSAAVESGYRRATDISGGLELGFGPVDLNIVDGRRQSAADAYLWPAIKRRNLQLVTDAVVHRLIIQRGRCVGVEYTIGHAAEVSRALAGEVILTAGAIGSPQVLMSSGIGPESHLREVGVPVQLDLPGVGSNLQDHAWVMIAHRAARPVPPARNNHGEVIGVLHSGIASGAPDLQIIFSDSARREFTGVDGIDPGYAIGVCMMRPFSRGTVRLSRSGTRPIVDPNYFDDDRDMRVMIAGLRMARDIGRASSLDAWRGEEVSPGPGVQSDENLRDFVWRNFTSYTHLVGTCAIGDAAQSVVDTELRVGGIDGLRVADASVMPTVPSNNTVATVYALAERAIELIVGN